MTATVAAQAAMIYKQAKAAMFSNQVLTTAGRLRELAGRNVRS
jgi:hypothetical protein